MSKKVLQYRIVEKKIQFADDTTHIFYVQKLVKNFLGIKKWKTCGEYKEQRLFEGKKFNALEFGSYNQASDFIKNQRKKEDKKSEMYIYHYPEGLQYMVHMETKEFK